MGLKLVLCFLTIIIVCNFLVISEGLKVNDTGVCEAKISQRKTRIKPYIVALKKMCGRKKCTAKRTKTEVYSVTKKQAVCCKGYEYRSETDTCSPLCSTGCVGGRCVAPDVCACDAPAILNENNTCVRPTCDPPCVNAECHANNTCVCNQNFTIFNTTHCYHCDPGFELNGHFNCSPICTTPCVNSVCSAPETCTCFEGYREINGTCQPYCEGCINSKCVAPNVCECFEGYAKINETNCEPKCESCTGRCVGPNECDCDVGYKKIDGVCEPVCNMCVNGYCSAPNVCTCNDGYVKNETSQVCVRICPGSVFDDSGACVAEARRGVCIKL